MGLARLSSSAISILQSGGITGLISGTRSYFTRIIRNRVVPTTGRNAQRSLHDDLVQLSSTDSPTIVDGGANLGRETATYLEIFDDPQIMAIEPIPDLADKIRNQFRNDQVTVYEAALGDENDKVTLYRTENDASSSVRKPTDVKQQYVQGAEIKSEISVSQVPLDEIISKDVDIMKLDLEGHERSALQGAENILSDVELLVVEVGFIPFNENQPLFSDLDIYLRDQGFYLYNFYGLHTEEDGQLAAGDAIYRRKKFN